jgi:hypothetical protein
LSVEKEEHKERTMRVEKTKQAVLVSLGDFSSVALWYYSVYELKYRTVFMQKNLISTDLSVLIPEYVRQYPDDDLFLISLDKDSVHIPLSFIENMENMINSWYQGSVYPPKKIVAPFISMRKTDIMMWAYSHGFLSKILQSSYDCTEEDHTMHDWGQGCGYCEKCTARKTAYLLFKRENSAIDLFERN